MMSPGKIGLLETVGFDDGCTGLMTPAIVAIGWVRGGLGGYLRGNFGGLMDSPRENLVLVAAGVGVGVADEWV